MRNPADHFGRTPLHAQAPPRIGVVFRIAAELDLDRPFRPGDFPRISEVQPFVREFDLPAVADHLIENAELVADAVTERRHFQSGEGVEVARRQSPEAAIAETGFRFVFDQILEANINTRQRLLHVVVDAEIDEIGRELGADQEFGREIGDDPRFRMLKQQVERAHPALEQAIAHRIDGRQIVIVEGRGRGMAALEEVKIVANGAAQGFRIEAGPDVLVENGRHASAGSCLNHSVHGRNPFAQRRPDLGRATGVDARRRHRLAPSGSRR